MRLFPIALILGCGNAFAAGSLCERSESVVFSCHVGRSAKLLSLCASPDLAPGRGHLAYRFGTPLRIELEFPKRGTPDSAKKFRYAHYFRAQVDRTEISFEIGEYAYTVFSYYDAGQKPATSEGVRVGHGRSETMLICRDPASANFAPLEPVVPCDEENALASC